MSGFIEFILAKRYLFVLKSIQFISLLGHLLS